MIMVMECFSCGNLRVNLELPFHSPLATLDSVTEAVVIGSRNYFETACLHVKLRTRVVESSLLSM